MAAVNRRLLLEACFLVITGVFRRRRRRDRKDRELMFRALKLNFSPIAFQRVDFLLLFSVFLWKFVVKTVVFLYFLHKKCQVNCFLNVCVGSYLEKHERMQCILVLLLSLRSLWSLESVFHMIAKIATIAKIELKSIFFSAIAAILAIIWKPGLTYG